MIDFRYHLVSIVAVFLALTVGIVLGSTELQGTVASGLSHANSSLYGQLSNVAGERDQAKTQASASDAWLQANEPGVLHGLLDGQRIVIFNEPGAPSSVISGIVTAAGDAGATVTGQINLQPKFFDTSSTTIAALTTMNSQLASTDQVPVDDTSASAQQTAAQILASQILVRSTGSGIQPASDLQSTVAKTTLSAYAGNGFLSTVGQPATQATLAVVITPGTVPSDGTVDSLDQVLGPFSQELAKSASGVVVVSSIAGNGTGSPIEAVRGNAASAQVSTEDDADTVRGQMATIQALNLLLKGHPAAAWGMDEGSPAYPAISPAPAACASPSPSASTKSSKSRK